MAANNANVLPKSLFDTKINTQAIFDVIMSERASQRQGTHKVKNRAEVSGTGKKPWAQKGTGKARAGTLRSNIFVGGGVSMGPSPSRNYALKVNKKVRKAAFSSALTLKAKEKAVLIKEFALKKPTTKGLLELISEWKLKVSQKKVLLVSSDFNLFKSASNLQRVSVVKLNSLTVENIVNADVVVFHPEDLKVLAKLEGDK